MALASEVGARAEPGAAHAVHSEASVPRGIKDLGSIPRRGLGPVRREGGVVATSRTQAVSRLAVGL